MADIQVEHSTSGLTEQMRRFLAEHRLMVLATGGPTGAPNVSTVVYAYDGNDVVVSSKRYTAHSRNIARVPEVAFVVNDGRAQLMVYGRAAVIADDPERLELSKRVFRRFNPDTDKPGQDEAIRARLDAEQRTVIRIVPGRGHINP